jgi:hypothetical protein
MRSPAVKSWPDRRTKELSGGIMLSSHGRRWVAIAALAGAVLTSARAETVTAIWKIQRIEFTYSSATVRYSCEALQRRIAAILHAVGAHSRMAVELSCAKGEQVRFATAQLQLAVPVEATEENVRAATDFDTRDELVARLQQSQLPTAEDVQRFPASWRTVALTRSPPLSLGPGDCDLLRAMRDHVFPHLHVTVVSSGLNCGSGPDTRITPRIRVNALLPVRT